MVAVALAAVVGAAVCSGVATVLQSVAAGRLPRARRPDASLVRGLGSSRLYVGSLGLVAVGFLLALLAVGSLPLFLVQAGRASSLAVTAVLSVVFLGRPLGRRDVVSLVAVAAGLLLLAAAADPAPSQEVADPVRWALLGAALGLGLLGALVTRTSRDHHGGAALAVLAGGGFALLALGARTLDGLAPLDLLTDPAAWAMGVAGLLGLLLSAMAFQRSSVVTVTAVLVATETVCAAVLGAVVNGDRTRDGLMGVAVVGFLLAIGGALGLARVAAVPTAVEEPSALLGLPSR